MTMSKPFTIDADSVRKWLNDQALTVASAYQRDGGRKTLIWHVGKKLFLVNFKGAGGTPESRTYVDLESAVEFFNETR